MRKLSPLTQAKLVSCSRAKKHPTAPVYPSSSFSGSDPLPGCVDGSMTWCWKLAPPTCHTAPTCAAKRPNNIEDNLLRCSSQIPVWGTRRPQSALLLDDGDDLLLRSSQTPPVWGAKRARSALALLVRGSDWRDWTNLGDGPAGLIAERLLASDVADYVSFRAAGRPWRLCCTDPRAHGILDRRFHPRQWIMLRAAPSPSPLRRSFLNVSTGCSRYVHLPELRGHDVFGPTSEGLLVLLDRTTSAVRLLNPFTRQAAELPPATVLMNQRELGKTHLRRVLSSVSGAGLADDSTFAVYFPMIRTLAAVKPGDVQWTVVHREQRRLLRPAMSFAGRFYCATEDAVMVVEPVQIGHRGWPSPPN